jgi:hypothetical protein
MVADSRRAQDLTMTLLKCSPLSSRDGGESARGTPDTKITAFSPEDIRSVKPTVGKSPGTLLGVAHHDPFVTTVPKQKTGKSPQDHVSFPFWDTSASALSISLSAFSMPLFHVLAKSHLLPFHPLSNIISPF